MRMEEKDGSREEKRSLPQKTGKLEEIAQLPPASYEVFDDRCRVDGDIAENGSTFAENALIKARRSGT